MTRPITLPGSLCEFIRSRPTLAAVTPPAHGNTWPESDDRGDATAAPPSFPPPRAWLAARDAYISHVMTCPLCVTSGPKVPRHCPEGVRLRERYDSTPYDHATD
ncbi:hypothetical protein I7V28_13090 [Lelliottia amnigena]|uniref:hypothetical protein n=1 Tax=Lelliottia amnigena TaxID=61646 RepID=UPI00192A738F|nr:hypothetical protein [Lelliottia amnigena]MBL5922029.1 hypothetical protein [Lelliottia amnigena]